MRVPHTIPKVVLKAYSRKLDEEALQKSYEGRLLRSEDPSWDAKVQPTLAQKCLDQIVDDYVFYQKLVEELNKVKLEEHEKSHDQWVDDLAEYQLNKGDYERRKLIQDESNRRKLLYGEDVDNVDDVDDMDDDDLEGDSEDPDRIRLRKGLMQPEEVPSVFPEFEPLKGILDQMTDEDRVLATEDLDIEYVPFEMAIKTIPDDYYWERAALERWPFVPDCDNHGKKWRRLFLEKNLWEAIEAFHPLESDLQELATLIELTGAEIIELRLNNLIPNCFGTPRKEIQDKVPEADWQAFGPEDEGFGDEEDPDDPKTELVDKEDFGLKRKKPPAPPVPVEVITPEPEPEVAEEHKYLEHGEGDEEEASEIPGEAQPNAVPGDEALGEDVTPLTEEPEEILDDVDPKSSSHINFNHIIPKLFNLKVLSLVFEMQDTGLDFEPRFFQFTDIDCLSLARAIAQNETIETFELLRSHVNDEQCKTIVREGLIKMPHLRIINFSYNRIGNVGARAIAKLLTDESARAIHTIHTVKLIRNRIYNAGAKALAWVLTKNRHLTYLDLRLNRFGDPAGRDFAHALVKNTSLLCLSLGANRLTANAANIFGKMLFHNSTLKELDLSSNDLGKKGGEYIALGVRANKVILRLDVRLSNIGLDFEYDLGTHLRKNRNRVNALYYLVERDDHYPPEAESGILVENSEEMPEWDDDDEEEEEETEEEEEEEGEDDNDDDLIVTPSQRHFPRKSRASEAIKRGTLQLTTVKAPTDIIPSEIDLGVQ